MKPKIKSINGAGFDWVSFTPEHERNFEVYLEVGLGPSTDDSSEIFQFRVCTPTRIEAWLEENKPMWGINTLFVNRFEREQVEAALEELVRRMGEGTWDVLRQRLKGFIQSEYEGMLNGQ
ncbi:MAG: Imm8 family immunity protein [Pseudomonadota bacterium]